MKNIAFHVKHLGQPLCLLGLVFLLNGCIPIRMAPKISGFEVAKGKSIDKRIKIEEHIFIFENPKHKTQFENFLEKEYKLIPYGYSERYEAVLNDHTFDVRVNNFILSDNYIALTDAFDQRERDTDDSDSYHYIGIRVSAPDGDDCLAVDSMYYKQVLLYL